MPSPQPERRDSPSLFATTRWTLVVEAAGGEDRVALDALGDLFQIYWQPLYRYARRKGKSREDAEDLVQGFVDVRATHRKLDGAGVFRRCSEGHLGNLVSSVAFENLPEFELAKSLHQFVSGEHFLRRAALLGRNH